MTKRLRTVRSLFVVLCGEREIPADKMVIVIISAVILRGEREIPADMKINDNENENIEVQPFGALMYVLLFKSNDILGTKKSSDVTSLLSSHYYYCLNLYEKMSFLALLTDYLYRTRAFIHH